jgi:dolichol-phosphate mannosyltransferase
MVEVKTTMLQTWEIPNYEAELFLEKSEKYCVVIPVINEGTRIHALLQRMQDVNISSFADIIIVDGGSNDGSLTSNILKQMNISVLLTKTGKGKLGSQLRCAYSFAISNGYDGIITIDGNNKDDPKAILDFINTLEKGYDFVQASRFVRGGIGINTPLMRYLAIRFIHAPILSLFSGFWWTDTTQGFRGYSRKLLMDEQIGIFREIFQEYELLAYLNYRAPLLGYRCIELPSIRIYPKGNVPTKIKGFKGQFRLLEVLIKTCLKKYNP